MKMLRLQCLILSLAIAGIAGAIEYNVGSPLMLSVRPVSVKATAGQIIHIAVTVSDVDYVLGRDGMIQKRIDDPVKLTWQATSGEPRNFPTGKTNEYDLVWTAPVEPGYYAIFLTAADSGQFANDPTQRQIVDISVERLNTTVMPTVRVTANPQSIYLNKSTTSTITAQLTGDAVAGKTVTFFSTAGTLSATRVTTDANGAATVRFTAGENDLGPATVAASYGNTTITTTVNVFRNEPRNRPTYNRPTMPVLPPYQPQFLIGVDPPTLPADGRSTAIVSMRLTDARGLGIRNQIVTFTVSYGTIQGRVITDYNGYARAQLLAPPAPGTALIIAQTGTLRSYATVEFVPLQQTAVGPPKLYLTVTPTSVMADGAARIQVEALALDSNGFILPNAPVTFYSTLGAVQTAQVTTNQDGRATTILRAPTTPGVAVVTARLDQITAASQVTFQGIVQAETAFDIRVWGGQQTAFVTENWLYRKVHLEKGKQGATTQQLQIYSAEGDIAKQIDLGTNGLLILDQYGAACGYGAEDGDKLRLELLKADGTTKRTIILNLPVGSHLVDARYASAGGQILAALSRPDGGKPEVYFYSSEGVRLFSLREGLESMPVMALGGDGYLAVALGGGTLRLYNPQGDIIMEKLRADKLPASQLAVGPLGAWVALATEATEKDGQPQLTVYSRQGTELVTMPLACIGLAPAGKDGLMIATADSSRLLNLATKKTAWIAQGGAFERFVEADGIGIIAGQRDPKTKTLISQITIIRMRDGKVLGSQTMADLREICAVLPPDDTNQFGVVAADYTFRFPVPAQK